MKEYQRQYTDKRRQAKRRVSLKRRTQVWVKTLEDKERNRGTVEKKTKEPESYSVRTKNKTFRRNRKHLRKLKEQPEKSRSQSTFKEDVDEEGYESETSSEECGQGNKSSSRDSSTNNGD